MDDELEARLRHGLSERDKEVKELRTRLAKQHGYFTAQLAECFRLAGGNTKAITDVNAQAAAAVDAVRSMCV